MPDTEATRTAGPYEVVAEHYGAVDIYAPYTGKDPLAHFTGNRTRVAKTRQREGRITLAEAEANAAFITLACNAHDALLAAAGDMMEMLNAHGGGLPEPILDAMHPLGAAIAAASEAGS